MRPARQSRPARRSPGQVLIYMVMILVSLLVMTVFLFDLQYFIRLRARTQTGVDAAVMAAATWQGRTLNLLGDINLLKASTLMLYGLPEAGSQMGIPANDALLSEMQVRMAYVGPLLGYAAAQQAAKQNGLREVPDFTSSLRRHAVDWVATLYPSIYNGNNQGFLWIQPYADLLTRVADEGVVAKPVNSRYLLGMPQLRGTWAAMLMDRAFYSAVNLHLYCYFINRGIMEADVNGISFDDIRLDQTVQDLFIGSEFLPLYVGFASNYNPLGDLSDDLLQRGLTPLSTNTPELADIRWLVYDLVGDGYGWGVEGSYPFINTFMRSDFRPEFVYNGAAARMYTQSQPSLLSGNWSWRHGQQVGQATSTSLTIDPKTGLPLHGPAFSGASNRLAGAESQLEQLRTSETVVSVAAAKPFGAVDSAPPYTSGLVLPVFTDTRLIPAALVHENDSERGDEEFIRFLVEYFGHPSYPAIPSDELDDLRRRFPRYVRAIEAFLDPSSSFRVGWRDFEPRRDLQMNGPDGIPGTADDGIDVCNPPPPPRPPGGGGGGGGGGGSGPGAPSTGGPPILH